MRPPIALGARNVARLGLLVAAAEENDDCPSPPAEVDAVTGARVNPKLVHALADRLRIAEVALAKTRDASSCWGATHRADDR